MNATREDRITNYVTANKKNVLAAFALAVLFGPIGYLYTSVVSGSIVILLTLALGLLSPGFAVLFWVFCIIAAPFEVVSQNKKLRAKAELMAG